MRLALARLLVVAAALLVLPGNAWAQAQLLCRMPGRVQSTCCCAAERELHAASSSAELRRADCCQRLSSGDASKVASAKAMSPTIEPATPNGFVTEPVYRAPLAPVPELIVRQSRGP